MLGHSSGVNVSLQLWGICKIAAHEHLACSVFESPWFRGKLASEFDTSTPQLLTHYRVYCSKLISCSKISRFRRSPTRMHISLEIVKADWSYFIYHTCHLPVTTVWAAIATQSQFHSRSKTLTQGVPFGGLVKTDLVWYRYGCFMDIFFITGLSYLTEQRGWRTAPCRQSGRGGEQQPAEGWFSLGPVFPVRGQTSRCHQSSPGTEARHISF